jgi:uncharacterized membrane protein (UPF0127 family)
LEKIGFRFEEWILRSYGLMGRIHLGRDEGMLFIFETEDYHGFWMKDTLLPLSIAFIGKDGRIVWITDMKPLTSDSHVPPPDPSFMLWR